MQTHGKSNFFVLVRISVYELTDHDCRMLHSIWWPSSIIWVPTMHRRKSMRVSTSSYMHAYYLPIVFPFSHAAALTISLVLNSREVSPLQFCNKQEPVKQQPSSDHPSHCNTIVTRLQYLRTHIFSSCAKGLPVGDVGFFGFDPLNLFSA